eukprot:Awhi_evm1s15282
MTDKYDYIDLGEKRVKVHSTKMLRNHLLAERLEDTILPEKSGFAWYFVGAANSGKTTLLLSLINNEYKKCFNRVILYSPSCHTMGKKLQLPEERLKKDLSTLEQDLDDTRDEYKKGLTEGVVYSTLLIFDDNIANIKKNGLFRGLVFNRAHSGISLMITSQ